MRGECDEGKQKTTLVLDKELVSAPAKKEVTAESTGACSHPSPGLLLVNASHQLAHQEIASRAADQTASERFSGFSDREFRGISDG
jgi:hypothetical protein